MCPLLLQDTIAVARLWHVVDRLESILFSDMGIGDDNRKLHALVEDSHIRQSTHSDPTPPAYDITFSAIRDLGRITLEDYSNNGAKTPSDEPWKRDNANRRIACAVRLARAEGRIAENCCCRDCGECQSGVCDGDGEERTVRLIHNINRIRLIQPPRQRIRHYIPALTIPQQRYATPLPARSDVRFDLRFCVFHAVFHGLGVEGGVAYDGRGVVDRYAEGVGDAGLG